MIHLGSLLHDDVVDDSRTRRGRATAHLVWGQASTVLSGDFCLARAVLLAAETGGHGAVRGLAEAVTRMAEGEVLQLRQVADFDGGRAAYHEVVDRKSAALIAWCAAAGALASGDGAAADALARFGRAAGRAFQITDDVLDYAPSTGKERGSDLRERKATLPLLIALERAPELRSLLGAENADVDSLMSAVRATGALEAALDEARALARTATTSLSVLPASEAREALALLGAWLVERAS
jgi:octaprenyl-diphosphate synthase